MAKTFTIQKPGYNYCLLAVVAKWHRQVPVNHFWAEDDKMATKIARAYTKSYLALARMKRLGVTAKDMRLVRLAKKKKNSNQEG